MNVVLVSHDWDADKVSGNIRDGVEIDGVVGNFSGGGGAIFGGSYFYNYSLITPTILIAIFSDLNRPANSGEIGDFLCEYNNRIYYFYSQNTGNYGNTKKIGYIPSDNNSIHEIHTYGTSNVYSDDRTHQKKFDSVAGKIYYSIIDDPSGYDYYYKVWEIDLNTEVVTNLWNSGEGQHTEYNNYRAGLPGVDVTSGILSLNASRGNTYEIKINVVNYVSVTGQTHMSIGGINISNT